MILNDYIENAKNSSIRDSIEFIEKHGYVDPINIGSFFEAHLSSFTPSYREEDIPVFSDEFIVERESEITEELKQKEEVVEIGLNDAVEEAAGYGNIYGFDEEEALRSHSSSIRDIPGDE